MERIRLTREERVVLRMISSGQGFCPAEYPSHSFNGAVRTLERKGLVRAAYAECGSVQDSALTPSGKQYIAENPLLLNPVNWGLVIAALTTAVSIAALFVACGR